MANAAAPAGARRDVSAPFGRIVCAVDGSRTGHLAVEQAVALSDPATALVFVCAREAIGAGASSQATITVERADQTLREAVRTASEAGIDAAAELLSGHDRRSLLLDEASRADLLVLPGHGETRAGGIAVGSAASAALHRATVPVLIARRPPAGEFPRRILVATDGSADAERAVELAARIGTRHAASVYLVSVDPARHGDPSRVEVHAAELTAALEVEPSILRLSGHADERILEAADAESVSPVALGSRGLKSVRALGSVSERVAHRAHCSVLVARAA
ncbi:MAG: universal stress protein [Thermoleophilaceae bacterium]